MRAGPDAVIFPKFPDERFEVGLLKFVWFSALNASHLNSTFCDSVIGKFFMRVASRLTNFGPKYVLRPRLPFWPVVGIPNAVFARKFERVRVPSGNGLPTRLGRSMLIPSTLESTPEVTVNGLPEFALRIPLACQPLRICFPTKPNRFVVGSSYTPERVNRWRG